MYDLCVQYILLLCSDAIYLNSKLIVGIVDMPGLDIFGQELKKSTLECVCPNCDRPMAASRFAPHLEKCMGQCYLL